MPALDSFLELVVDQRASDLHFSSGGPPAVRFNGELIPVPFRSLSEPEARRFLYELMTPEQQESFETRQELDFAYELPGLARFRANVFVHRSGIGAVFRVIPEEVPTLAELRLPTALRRVTQYTDGLVLFTGPTGSGKTTTQAAIIQEINRTRPLHILTIEDPIEFLHTEEQAVITQRQVGLHTASFHEALRSALRESPDVILVGEMRDHETISLALAAAETGVLVFGTLHTGAAANAVDRIVDVFPEEQAEQVRGSVSVTLRAIVAQRLVKEERGTGRAAAVELLFNNTAVAHMLRQGKSHQIDAYLQQIDARGGNLSLDRSLLNLVRSRRISVEEAAKQARFPQAFLAAAEQVGGRPSS
ncbi:MAG: PilT/PilU family type 4a pilus ATPase [Deltaproteobacteria bacterium]|nr:PilT/PilU family type 4a pilus ATPase [Deltaproteobacteria bacterium]